MKPRKIGRFAIIKVGKVAINMALNMTKKEVEQLQALKKKQKAINKQRSRFKRMIIENQDFVRQVLEENEAQERHFVGQRAQAEQGVQGGVTPAF